MNGDRPCKKKIELQGNVYYCSACNKTYSDFKRRLILSVKLIDATAEVFVSLFDDDVCRLFNWTLDDISKHTEESLKDAAHSFLFKPITARLTFKKEFYQERGRIRVSANQAEAVDPKVSGRKMLQYIRKLKAGN